MMETPSVSPFTDGPPPPSMCDAWLTVEQVGELFDDLAGCTEILAVQIKANRSDPAGTDQTRLSKAHQQIVAGEVRGVQIRYRYQYGEWCDTIMNIQGRFRLIRAQFE